METLLTTIEEGIYEITINRPEKLNALNAQVMEDLNAAMDEVERNDDIRAVIITGAGEKAFVAGADISEFLGLSAAEGKQLAKRGSDVFFRIENSSKPVMAAVNGFALGGGCELAMACHFRYAGEKAKFGQPEVNLGLIPGYGGTQRLVHLVGKGRAMELLMSGNMIDAARAYRIGLVNEVFPAAELLTKSREILKTIISKAPKAVGACIRAANEAVNGEKGYEVELEAFSECFTTDDMKEGTTAFLEKRKAHFTGR